MENKTASFKTQGRYPVGDSSFSKIRNKGQVYVDKTALLYQLTHDSDYYFLSRPRRFGKSLMLSTLHAYFEGRKELFEDLAISQLEKEWKVYPIIHLSMGGENIKNLNRLELYLTSQVDNNAELLPLKTGEMGLNPMKW